MLKLARGNPGKRAINHDEPELPPAEPAKAEPIAFTGKALEEYTRLRPTLIDAGVLTSGDEFVFETYCRLVGEVHDYEAKIAACGLEDAHRLGYANYLFKLRNQAVQYAARLGLTPSDRAGIKIPSSVRRQRAEAVDANAAKRRKHFGGQSSA